MGQKKKKFVRKITKTGGYALYVILPKELTRELNWKEHQKVTVEKAGTGIRIRDWKKK